MEIRGSFQMAGHWGYLGGRQDLRIEIAKACPSQADATKAWEMGSKEKPECWPGRLSSHPHRDGKAIRVDFPSRTRVIKGVTGGTLGLMGI